MSTTSMTLGLAVGAIAISVAAGSAQASIVVSNSSFDPPTENTADNPNPGYGPITNWNRSTSTIGVNGGSLNAFLGSQVPRDGTHTAFLQAAGNISQTLSGFDPTKQYTVTYFVSERGLSGSTFATTSVSLDGGTTTYSQPDNILKTDKFRRIVSSPLSVSGASSTLRINNGTGSGDYTLFVDAVSVTRAVPVVPNGGFEIPVQPNTNTTTRYKLAGGGGGGSLTGASWTFGSASGITRNASAFTPPTATEGSQAAILRSNESISVNVDNFEAGVTYSLSFAAAGRAGGLGPTVFQVLLDGNLLTFSSSTSITPAINSYTTYTSDSFTTNGGTLSLLFQGLTAGDKTTYLDDVRFNFIAEAPVPEPASLALLGLGGLLALRRRPR